MRTLIHFLLLVCLASCGGTAKVKPAHRDAPFKPQPVTKLRLVLIGDTGSPGPILDRVKAAVKAERKDAVLVLGDLVYPFAPKCPSGEVKGQAKRILENKVGAALNDLGAPVLLMLGNHDAPYGVSQSPSEACLIDYAAQIPQLIFPGATYVVDYGVATMAITNTMHLTAADGRRVASVLKKARGWRLGFGHHVYRTYRDKGSQDVVRPWVKRHGIPLDLWGNGHAHILQFGVYDDVAAVTSGTAALPRKKATCPPACGKGELFGASVPGYAVVELTTTTMRVEFKDTGGQVLYSWTRSRTQKAAK